MRSESFLSRLARPLLLVLFLTGAASGRADASGPSSRRTSWAISEIQYHPAPRTDGRNLEFVEIQNAGLVTEDLGGHRLEGEVAFVFPRPTRVPAGGFVVVAPAPGDLETVYGLTGVLAGGTNRLSNSSGTLRLFNPAGALLLDVRYSDDVPWPAAADGGGPSLVLARPSFGESDPRAWAASTWVGGSPGRPEDPAAPPTPFAGVGFNELLAHTDEPQLDFVEIRNGSRDTVDLAGCRITDDPAKPGFLVPAGTMLAPGGRVAFDQAQLGFALDAAGETLFLHSPDGTRVIDAVRFGPQANGVAFGRHPEGSPVWRELAEPTPGLANASPRPAAVVINEIMFHPPRDPDGMGEYVELFNPGSAAVDLSGWRFVDGIEFEFPAGTGLGPGGYLVVARDAAGLRSRHPGLTAENTLGNFAGALADGGERLALARPEWIVRTNGAIPETNRVFVVVNEVRYGDGGRWGRWADGGGSSLELVDPGADNRWAANWADSDETRKAPWTLLESTGTLDHGSGTPDRLQILALGAGAFLVDDVEARAGTGGGGTGANLVSNGAFSSGTTGWSMNGTQDPSRWEPAEGATATGCLRVEAVARGDTGANRIQTSLASGLAAGGTGTIRARVRWLYGHPEALLRFRGNHLEAHGPLALPPNPGTPGARNSRALVQSGPVITDLLHAPVLPAPGNPVTVTARLEDPDGLGEITLRYRVDPAAAVTDVPMRDDGLSGDGLANDGVFGATIPGQATGRLVGFQIVAADAAASPATSTYPTGEALVRFGEARPAGGLGVYRLWMTQATANRWSSRPKLDNKPLPVTFVYNDERVVHGVGALYAGSPHISPGYSGPTGSLCGYVLIFPKDDRFLGATDVVLDWPGRDSTAQQEPMAYWIARELGIPFNHRRYIRLHVNGVTETARGSVYEDAQQVNSDSTGSWSPEADGGDLHKIEQWFEFDDGFGTALVVAPRLENYTTTGGAKKLARYRWSWLKRAADESASDYRALFTLVDAANAADPEVYLRQLEAFVDLEEWMRIFATENIVVNLDAWGYDIGKNMYAWKPRGGRWQLHMWDIDWVMLASAQHGYNPQSTLMYLGPARFGDANRDPVVGRMYQHPAIQRAYWRAIRDAVDGPLRPESVADRMDATHAALVAAGVTRSSGSSLSGPATVKTWLAQRRTYLLTQLATVAATFAVDPPPATVTGTNLVTLSGTAPIEVKDLRVNGRTAAVTWSTTTRWSATLPLAAGANPLRVEGFDGRGIPVPGAAATVSVRFDGTLEPAPGRIVINEIQPRPAVPGAGFVELFNRSAHTAYDLADWRLDGTALRFGEPTLLRPGGFAVVAADRQAFSEEQGILPRVAAEFPGTLAETGETLTLVAPDTSEPVDLVTYETTPPWPAAPSGSGASLQLIDAAQDNRRPGNWAATATATPAQPQVLVPLTQEWRYRQGGGDPGANWMAPGFDDATWPAGGALLYVENSDLPGPKVTPLVLGATTYHFRTRFRFEGDPAGVGLALTTVIDDGAIVYLNGVEILRLGMPDGPVTPATFAARNTSDAAIEGPFTVPAVTLRSGDNVLAVEVHQVGASSSDVTFGLSLETTVAPRTLATPGRANSVAASLPTLASVWINELQADNRTGPRDRAGDRDPWLELHNLGPTPLSLAGLRLANAPGTTDGWSFPDTATLPPGGFRLVWLDGEPGESAPDEDHASFRLPTGSGYVALIQVAGARSWVLDAVAYQDLPADTAIGWLPDGAADGRWVLPVPSPGTANAGTEPLPPVSINEWMAANQSFQPDPADGNYDDWFELHNAGELPVDLGGYRLSDDPAEPAKFVIPPGTLLAPRGFLRVWADEDPEQSVPGGDLHATFRLSVAGETLTLSHPDGRVVDTLRFGAQSVDVTEGRWPDGGAIAATPLARPTPGAANARPAGAGSELRITGVGVDDAGQVTVTWLTVAGGVYRLQSASEVRASEWTDVTADLTATGDTLSYSQTSGAGANARFYRVHRVQ
jgi:hypothetical protein